MERVENFIEENTRSGSNELVSVETIGGKKVRSYHKWLTPENAIRAAEIASGETIEKMCRVLEEELLPTKNKALFIEKIRKAMVEE